MARKKKDAIHRYLLSLCIYFLQKTGRETFLSLWLSREVEQGIAGGPKILPLPQRRKNRIAIASLSSQATSTAIFRLKAADCSDF
ncbi:MULTISPECIES: hypothetical protein [Aerosakkonema]|uniref:hypothetical protein n=1 Tax=Aerosakkonema TaxID=1246629 RepID=UPI0035B6F079